MLNRKIKILKNFLGECFHSKDELLFSCPKCKHHKKKLSVNLSKNVFKCWICDYNGRNIGSLVNKYGKPEDRSSWRSECGVVDMSEEESGTDKGIIEVSLPEEFVSLTGQPDFVSKSARSYLASRGVSKEDILWWKMGFCCTGPFANRIIVPSFDLSGDINYFIARNYENNFFKYKNPEAEKDFVFNELYLDWNQDVVLVEGVFDAVIARNAIPLLGSTLREDSYIFQKILQNCSKIFIALDADVKKKEDKIVRMFLTYGINVFRIDTNGFEDVGSMPREEFFDRKNAASLVTLDTFLLDKLLP